MKLKLSIRTKMLLSIITSVVIIFIISIGYISYQFRLKAYNDAKDYIDANVREHANLTMAELNSDMDVIRTLAQSFIKYKNLPEGKRAEIYRDMYETVFINNPQFYGIWDSWELNIIDSEWELPYGRYVEEFWRKGNQIFNNNSLKSLEGDNTDYARIKRDKLESIEEPYYYAYSGGKEDEVLMTSFICPILDNENFIGVVGTDITLDRFQKQINTIKPYNNSYAFLVSNNGIFVTHPDTNYINKSITEIFNDNLLKNQILENIKNGKKISFVLKNEKNKVESYISFAPVYVGDTDTPWSIAIVVPLDVILAEANSSIQFTIFIGIIGLLLIVTIIWIIAYSITKPLRKVVNYAKSCSNGQLNTKININRNDEIGELAISLKTSTEYFKEVIGLAKQITKGNLSEEIVNKLDSKKGELIDSLKEMVVQLRKIVENIKMSTKEIMHVSDSLMNKAKEINDGASQQEMFTEEVSQSMVKIEKISENAANDIIEGSDRVSETVSSMKNIVDKTKVIDSIYSKTNFIAVNAAVEAARADKYGKGFAIVAKEIQKLAEQSKNAANDIDNLSKSSITNAQNSISNLQQIIKEILKTSQLIKEISGTEVANTSKSNGHSNILKLKEITTNNLQISNEISQNAQELAERTIVLNDMLNFFQVE